MIEVRSGFHIECWLHPCREHLRMRCNLSIFSALTGDAAGFGIAEVCAQLCGEVGEAESRAECPCEQCRHLLDVR